MSRTQAIEDAIRFNRFLLSSNPINASSRQYFVPKPRRRRHRHLPNTSTSWQYGAVLNFARWRIHVNTSTLLLDTPINSGDNTAGACTGHLYIYIYIYAYTVIRRLPNPLSKVYGSGHLHFDNSAVKNMWSYTSATLYALITWYWAMGACIPLERERRVCCGVLSGFIWLTMGTGGWLL
jgi:hypothetical protein